MRWRNLVLSFMAIYFSVDVHRALGESRTSTDAIKNVSCAEISAKKTHGAIVLYRNSMFSGERVDLGEVRLRKGTSEVHLEDILLLTKNTLSAGKPYCGNSLCMDVQESKTACSTLKTFKVTADIDMAYFKPGQFEAVGELMFYDKTGNEVPTSISLTGVLRAPHATILSSNKEATDFLAGRKESLSFQIGNDGNADLAISDFSEITNTSGLHIQKNECEGKSIKPMESCVLQFTRSPGVLRTPPSEIIYDAAFLTNEAKGGARLQLSIAKEGEAKFRITRK